MSGDDQAMVSVLVFLAAFSLCAVLRGDEAAALLAAFIFAACCAAATAIVL